MAGRTPDTGVQPFEFRTGVNGLPSLGGIFRAGDPATIPPHKHHLLINVRIKPDAMVTRPGLRTEYDTGVEECIDGIAGDGEDISTTILYPAAEQGEVDVAVDPDFGGGSVSVNLNAMSFRAIFPRGGDVSYSEYVSVLYGQAGAVGGYSPVVEPMSLDGGSFTPYGTAHGRPFIANGRVHQFLTMPKQAEDGTFGPAIALCALDLPTRTKELASDCQRWSGYGDSSGLASGGSCPGDYPEDYGAVFPGSYPVGTANVVFFVDNPFTSPETLLTILDVLPMQRRADKPLTGETGVREMLYFLAVGSADAIALVKWDGVVQTTIVLEAGLLLTPLLPVLGGQVYGPFVLGSTDGALCDWGGYLDASETWVPLTNGIRYDYGTGGAPPAPGVVDVPVKSWAAVKQSVTGRPQVLVQAYMKLVYGGAWIDGHGMWVFEWDPTANEFNKVVATLLYPSHTGMGFPSNYTIVADQYHPLETLGSRYAALLAWADDVVDESVLIAPYNDSADYLDASDCQTAAINQSLIFSDWSKWLQNVSGRLYLGGAFYVTDEERHRVYDATVSTSHELLFDGDAYDASSTPVSLVSKGALPSVPAEEVGEGYGTAGGA